MTKTEPKTPNLLRDDEVALAPFLREHVNETYLAWINDPEIMRYTEARFRAHTRDSAEAYVEASNAGPSSRLWRIVLAGRHVGNLRLSGIDYMHRHASVALIIGDREVWGCGVGSAAICLACRYAFDALSLNKLTAGMYADNPGSTRAFEKAGFKREAVLSRHYVSAGRVVDGVLMARFADDPEP